MKLFCRDRRGQAFVFVLIITTAIFLIGSAALMMGSSVLKTAQKEKKQGQAYYVAEAGVEKAIAKALAEPDWVKTTLPESTTTSVSELNHLAYPDSAQGDEIKSVTVAKTTHDNYYDLIITSEGNYRQSRKIIEAKVRFYKPVDFDKKLWIGSSANFFNNGSINSTVWSNGDVTVENVGTVVGGDVYALGNVHVYQDAHIEGNIEAHGNIDVANNGEVNTVSGAGGWVKANGNITIDDGGKTAIYGQAIANGSITGTISNVKATEDDSDVRQFTNPNISFVLEDFPATTQEMLQGMATYSYYGAKTYTSADLTDLSGVSYVDGPVSISGSYSGVGTIVSADNMSITGNIDRLDNNSCLTLICFGNITFSSNCDPVAALFYTPNAIEVSQNVHITGAIVANTITTDPSCELNFDHLSAETPGVLGWNYKIISWKVT